MMLSMTRPPESGIVAERHDVIDGALVGDEFRPMVLLDPLADAAELQAHDAGQHLSRQRIIGDRDDAPEQRRRKHFEQARAQVSGERFGIGLAHRCLRRA